MKTTSGMVIFCALCWPMSRIIILPETNSSRSSVYFHGLDYKDVLAFHMKKTKSIVSALAYRSDN